MVKINCEISSAMSNIDVHFADKQREDFGYRSSLEFYVAVPCASWHCCANGIGSRSVHCR